MKFSTPRHALIYLMLLSLFVGACQTPVPPTPAPSAQPSPTAALQTSPSPTATPVPTPSPVEARVLSSDGGKVVPPSDAEVQALLSSELVAKYNAFGIRLYKELFANRKDETENVLISPLSIMLALSMAYNGAAGETRQEMAEFFDLQGFDLQELNELNSTLWRHLMTRHASSSPDLRLEIANSMWGYLNLELEPEFIARMDRYYQAQLALLPFQTEAEQSAERINQWIEERTQGLISKVLSPLEVSNAILFLINTVYFKVDWSSGFKDILTRPKDFELASGQKVSVPMMLQIERAKYWEDRQSKTQYLQKSFKSLQGTGDTAFNSWAMTFVLPSEQSSLEQEVENLTQVRWGENLKQLKIKYGAIQLPRFTSGYATYLKEHMTRMGLVRPFDPYTSDFTDLLLKNSTTIDDILHKTKIKVHENGVEAAAVTIVKFPLPSTGPQTEFSFEANRPFLYFIHDLQTGLILFIGSLSHLEGAEE